MFPSIIYPLLIHSVSNIFLIVNFFILPLGERVAIGQSIIDLAGERRDRLKGNHSDPSPVLDAGCWMLAACRKGNHRCKVEEASSRLTARITVSFKFDLKVGWASPTEMVGGKSTERTAFQDMIAYIYENPVNVLLTFKIDRLSRNLKDILIFIDDVLDHRGIALQSVTENFNTQSAGGRLFLQLLGSFA